MVDSGFRWEVDWQGFPGGLLQQIFDDASGFTSVQLQACSFTVVALFGVVVRTSLQADDPKRSCLKCLIGNRASRRAGNLKSVGNGLRNPDRHA